MEGTKTPSNTSPLVHRTDEPSLARGLPQPLRREGPELQRAPRKRIDSRVAALLRPGALAGDSRFWQKTAGLQVATPCVRRVIREVEPPI